MFGWEFPPHISGGLGTACFGIIESLRKSNTQILFVIPQADVKPIGEGLEIINASAILVPILSPEINQQQPEQNRSEETTTVISSVETIRVHSEIFPYTSPHVLSDAPSVPPWNFQLPETNIVSIVDPHTGRINNQAVVRYQFSGGYGPNLLEEVQQYGLVGAEIARQRNFDIIHVHEWLTFKAGKAAKEISGKPLIVHVHATEFDRAGKNVDARVFEIEREGMELADKVIAVSQWTKNIITSRYGISPDKVKVVHNGSLPQTDSGSIQLPPIGKRIVTFLGRITYQKGPAYFIDAAALVLKKFRDVHFVMAGSGDLLPEMIERVARLRIASHFHFTGFLKKNRVDQLWSATNLYVMPSVSEPFGISPLEAVQAGVPVIISNQSGVAEVMQHVVKVDFWNIEALADAMCNILKYSSLSETLKNKSIEEIAGVTWERAAKKINAIYHDLTK